MDRKYRPRDGGTLKASWDAEKRTGGKGGGDGGTAPRRAALDSDEAEMGSRAGDADGDRRVLGDAAWGDRGGGLKETGPAEGLPALVASCPAYTSNHLIHQIDVAQWTV